MSERTIPKGKYFKEPVEFDKKNPGKDYHEYLAAENRRLEAVRRARMKRAADARKDRIASGIDISIAQIKMNGSI